MGQAGRPTPWRTRARPARPRPVPVARDAARGRRRRRRPPPAGSTEADVAVVGAGFTGLWTAYYLARRDPGLRIVVLEREFAGFGASGRNGGWVSGLLPISLDTVAAASFRDAAPAWQRAADATV